MSTWGQKCSDIKIIHGFVSAFFFFLKKGASSFKLWVRIGTQDPNADPQSKIPLEMGKPRRGAIFFTISTLPRRLGVFQMVGSHQESPPEAEQMCALTSGPEEWMPAEKPHSHRRGGKGPGKASFINSLEGMDLGKAISALRRPAWTT